MQPPNKFNAYSPFTRDVEKHGAEPEYGTYQVKNQNFEANKFSSYSQGISVEENPFFVAKIDVSSVREFEPTLFDPRVLAVFYSAVAAKLPGPIQVR